MINTQKSERALQLLRHVNHVRNICHLELANSLTKRTLFVFG